jgi:putative tricarboxylic transport membrane protein
MLDGLQLFGQSIANFAAPTTIAYALGACLIGLIIGALPGLTATMGVALMTTLTISLPSNVALLILICTYVGAIYGGSRSAILLNIPGTPASAASCLDGYALARQGLAGRAMGIATSGSVLGTWIGMIALALFTPVLGEAALKFGAYEFFWLAVFGVVISGNLTGNDPLKGWIAGFLGLFIAAIGQEGMYAYDRFTFGIHDLSGGIALIPALVGAFGFAEVLTVIKDRPPKIIINAFDTVIPRIQDVARYWRTIIRSGLIGTGVGIVPGVGEDVAAWSSYAAARRASKEKDKFGKGSVEGLMAAETGDNACVPGSVIPVLTLAVPGSAPAAVLLAAMLIHGVQPGPLIMVNSPQFVYDVVAMMLFASIGILIYGLTLTQLLVKILQVPQTLVMPVVFVLCTVGSFAIASRFFDIYVMLAFGIVGFFLRQLNYPMAPLVLGIVLGDLLDKNLRRGLTLSDGDLSPFFTRPISFVMFCLVAGTILMNVPAFTHAVSRLWAAATAPLRRKSTGA